MNLHNQLRNSYIMLDFKDDTPEKSAEKPSSAKDKKGSSDKKTVKEDVTKKEKVNYRHCSFLKNILLFQCKYRKYLFCFYY